jgi:dGTPase
MSRFFRGNEPGYLDTDRERWSQEPPKDPRRGEFSRDRARVVHSSGLRRLSAKTQVVGPGSDDFVRNRLTHSLEVAQVGRELGTALGCDPDIVDTACLAHDLGHPPFGHNGEDVLADLADGIGGFEGNAQTLRMLTRLEPKVVDVVTGRGHGLNLTRASLDAATKYPWRRGQAPGGSAGNTASAKFGVYEDDLEVFGWLRAGAQPGRRCIEAQVMDLADDVAYSVHDVEDAVVSGRLDPRRLSDPDEAYRVAAQVRSWYLPELSTDDALAALSRLRSLSAWVPEFDGEYRSLAALKDMTSQLIGRFIRSVEAATWAEVGQAGRTAEAELLTRYRADVVVPTETVAEIAVLKGLAAVYVMTVDDRKPIYARQREVLAELVEALVDRAPQALDAPFATAWRQAPDDAARLRAVIDQVATLTDARALTLHLDLAG